MILPNHEGSPLRPEVQILPRIFYLSDPYAHLSPTIEMPAYKLSYLNTDMKILLPKKKRQ